MSAAAAHQTMQASVIQEYGAPTNLQLATVPKPMPSAKYLILVKVAFTTVNPADTKQRAGNLKLVVKHQFPVSFGQDFAGTVEAAPPTSRFKAGDHVYGCTAPRNGCGAEFVCVAVRQPSLNLWANFLCLALLAC